MIVRILDDSETFNGIDYNERKVKEGVAVLIGSSNIEAIGQQAEKQELKAYFNKVASLNPRVKIKQFHAIVSAKGNSRSFKELETATKEYMDEMGYTNSPYVIYSHSDTDNKHVHVVASRVDKSGKKVNDSFENIRSQAFIKNKYKIDYGIDSNKRISDSLEYSFSTTAQIQTLLERMGLNAYLAEKEVVVKKGGKILERIPINKIKITTEKTERKRLGIKHRQILKKYGAGNNHEDLKSILRSKFGIDLVLHYPKKANPKWKSEFTKQEPYGYTLIDHHNKTVFKGSEILKLNKLLTGGKMDNSMVVSEEVIKDVLVNKGTFFQLRGEFWKHGLDINWSGSISRKRDGKPISEIDKISLKALRYNGRAFKANKLKSNSVLEKELVAKLFFIDKDDIDVNSVRSDVEQETIENFKNELRAFLSKGIDVDGKIAAGQIRLVNHKDRVYFFDVRENAIYDVGKELGQNASFSGKGIKMHGDKDHVMKILHDTETVASVYSGKSNAILDMGAGNDDQQERKKRKKRNNQNRRTL